MPAVVPWLWTMLRKRSMKSRSFSGATAVSSTNEIDLASSFIAIESPSAASRRLQMRA